MSSAQSFTSIPLIDLSLSSNPSTEPQLLSQLRDALINIGFLYIQNHGVDPQVIADMRDIALPQLFNLSDAEKEDVALRKSPHFLGYSGDGAETTAGKSDRREQFEFATELESTWTEGVPLSERLRGPNPVRLFPL
jgi:isopenicillin N synthase-like dioxygenase